MSNNVVQSVATTTVSRFIHVSSFSAGKSKPKGKAPIALRKAPLTVLKLRYTNIIPKKVGGIGPTRKSTLNLAKHSVIVTSESGQPIVLGQLVAQQHSTSDNLDALAPLARVKSLDALLDSPSAIENKHYVGPTAMQQ
ncbi:hypothetical protein V6N12_024945 [Hibiscus sabdariffa]|uniref:Uncharacterized protein n=1 Tax=Hibiscus sabdariffa TaxID=183260 RepID=A0ABR2A576_9ROSI